MSKADRYNKGKPQYSLLDLDCLEPCVRVLEFGAKKYARNNWKKGLPTTQIIDSLLRHLGALLRGELIDPESALPHIGHIQCNALFLGNKNNEFDIVKTQDTIPTCQYTTGTMLLNCALPKTASDVVNQLKEDVKLAAKVSEEDWSSMVVESIPVSMEEYDNFVYQLEHPKPINEGLKKLFDSKYGLCPPSKVYDEYLTKGEDEND